VDAPTCNERLLLSLGYRYTVQRNAIGPRCILVICRHLSFSLHYRRAST